MIDNPKSQNRISRRDLLKLLGAIGAGAAAALYPSEAGACIGSKAENAFYKLIIEPLIANPELLASDDDGKVYVRFNAPRNTLREVINSPENFKSSSDAPKQERIYGTLDEAFRAGANQPNTHILELDGKGILTGIYDNMRNQLKLAMARPRGGCGIIYSF